MKKLLTYFVLTTFTLVIANTLYAQGTWTTASSDGFTARANATSGVIGGKIYVMGGYGAGNVLLNSLEVFDPSTNSWSAPTTTGTFTPRGNLTSAVVDGKIYVIGGYGTGYSNALEVFDPLTNAWSTPSTTGTFAGRINLTSAAINGKIYVIGGMAQSGYVTTIQVFDPATNQWSAPATTGTFTGRNYPTSNVIDNKIYTFGGYRGSDNLNTLEVFDPASNTWSTPTTTGTSSARRGPASGVMDGKMYVVGGYDGPFPGGNYLNTLEVFDAATNAWMTPVTSGNFTAHYLPTCGVIGGKMYVMGGWDNGVIISVVEVFTPESSSVAYDAASEAFALSPNPTSGIVTIHDAPLNTSNITVVNVLGETVLTQENVQAADFSVDLSNLPSGAYYLRIASPTSITTKMVVKK